MSKKIGFIGLGIMGYGMAVNLINKGFDVKLYNRTKEKAVELSKIGGIAVDTPAQAASDSDIIITIVSNPQAVEEVIYGKNGILETIKPGAVLIDSSTVDPGTSKKIAKDIESKGAKFIDAPVTGSKIGADTGTLVFMAGGDSSAIEYAKAAFDAMGKKTIHAGPNGSGSAIKLCFNLMVSHMAAALAETLTLGVKQGLNPEAIIDAIMSGMISSKFYEWKGNCMINRDFATNFSTKLMHKDAHLIMSTGYENGVSLPVSAAVCELLSMTEGKGYSEDDFCSVVKVLEEMAGTEVKK